MGNLYFSPKGRISPEVFQKSAITLIAISFVLNVLPLVSFALAALFGLVGLVMVWPWICIWIKRLHDAGKSGWMLLLVLLVMIVLSSIFSKVINSMFGVSQAEMQAAMSGADGIMGMFSAAAQASKSIILPNAVSAAAVGLIVVFGANKFLPSDPEENQYGPSTR